LLSLGQGRWWAAPALLALTLIAYSNSLRAEFALDNRGLILQDPRIREATSENIALILDHTYWWPSGEAGLYRPLTTLSYLFNYAILGNQDRPAGYHAVNLLLHAANTLLLFTLGLKLSRSFWPPLWGAAIWAVHPALTEAVTNIAGRADLLAALGVLAGFLMYLKSAGGSRRAWLAGVMLATAVGVFSKESAVVIVGVIALYEIGWRRNWRAMTLGIVAALPPIVWMLYRRSVVLAGSPPAELPYTDNPIAGADYWTGRLTALKAIGKYLLLAIWPAKLSSDYSYPAIPLARGSTEDWIAWIAVAAAAAGIALLYRWNRGAFFWAAFAAITLAPVSNLLFPIGTIMAERLLYLPLAGAMLCVALLVFRLPERMAIALAALAVVGLAARSVARNANWRDDLTIAEADVGSNSYKLHRLLALSLVTEHGDLKRATAEADRSVALLDSLPDRENAPDAYLLDGDLHLAGGDFPRGIALLEKCAAIDRSYDRDGRVAKTETAAYRSLSEAYLRLKDGAKARENARRALDLGPFDPTLYRQMAAVELQDQQPDRAVATLMAGMFLTGDPGLSDALLKLYSDGLDRGGCSTTNGPNGPAINPACPAVRAEICSAAVEVIHTRLHAGQADLARSHRSTFAEKYGCSVEELDRAFQ
jgi:tetratricopeptide (TPR) repeat protein